MQLDDGRNMADEVERRLQYERVLAALETLLPEQALAIRLKYVSRLREQIAVRAECGTFPD